MYNELFKMENLRAQFLKRLQHIGTDFIRSDIERINWDTRLVGIKGARGVGKTTLLLQHIKLNYFERLDSVLYVSMDSLHVSNFSLVEIARVFTQKGGKILYIDEIHKYHAWIQELKNIYDDYPDLKVVFTGSSLLEILHSKADLSRRAVLFTMQGLSFREYVEFEKGIKLPKFSLEEILKDHERIALELSTLFKPLGLFPEYLLNGYYPFYKEDLSTYELKLNQVVQLILEVELPQLRDVDIAYLVKLKQLLMIIAESVPFIPNVSKLSQKIGVHRNTLLSYLQYLDEVALSFNVYSAAKGTSLLQKPGKIYLDNTNLMYALSKNHFNLGTIREGFFANQLKFSHQLHLPAKGDFLVDHTYTFEVGGSSKGQQQIKGIHYSYIAADDIEIGYENKIPLWLFGFLY